MNSHDSDGNTSRDLFDETAHAQDSSSAPSIGIFDVLFHLVRNKRLIALVTAIAGLIGLCIGLSSPARYTATTTILTPQQTPSSAAILMSQMSNSGASALSLAAGSGLGLKNPNDIYIGLLSSREIADGMIQSYGLENVYRSRNMTGARKSLAANTKIVSERSGLISISFTDKDKNRAAVIANAYSDQLRNLSKKLANAEASQRRTFYEEQFKRVKEDLIASELTFQTMQKNKGMVQLDAQAKALITSLAALQAEVSAKKVELQALRTSSTENNSKVQVAESQLTALQGQLIQMEQREHSSGSIGIGLQDVADSGLDYLRAEHELQYQQNLLDQLTKQYDAAKLDEAKYATVVQVVDSAQPPDLKSSPHRAQIFLAWLFLGFCGACIWVLAVSALKVNTQFSQALEELKRAFLA
jgi:uncharacterized protein involved in exopolysaccharide biosynthesis